MSREKLEQAGLTPEQASALVELLKDGSAASVVARLDALQAEVTALSAKVEALQHLEAPVLAPLLRDEIRAFLAGSAKFKAPHLPITFDLICLDGIDPALLTRRDLFLDERTLDQHYEDGFSRMGAIPANKASRFVNRVLVKLSERIGARFAAKTGLPAALLSEALFFSISTETVRLVPARHMARRLARLAAGETVLIPLPGTGFTYLSGKQLEPFYLAAELQRRGVAVAFVSSDPALARQAREDGEIALRFEPDPALWNLPPLPDAPEAAPAPPGRAALVGAGIRGIAYILRKLGDPIKFQSPAPHIMDPSIGEPDYAILDANHLPVMLNLPFRQKPAAGHLGRLGIVLGCSLPHGDMGEYLISVLGGVINCTLERVRKLVRRHGITEAHICEHPFFESAILAHAVREAGGTVTLWPHSWGVSWWGLARHPGTAQEAYSVDRSGAAIWRQRLPDAKVHVVSNLYLPRYRAHRPVVPGEPLNVVIIGNMHNNERLPMIDRASLESISRKLLAGFAELPADIRWTYRPRGTPDLQWQWELAGRPADFSYTTLPPVLIDLPNMVFLFPGLLSSALIEGINRGVPAIVAREDQTIEDYLGSDLPDCVPMGDVAFVMGELLRCRDPVYRQALVDKQVAWCESAELNWEGD